MDEEPLFKCVQLYYPIFRKEENNISDDSNSVVPIHSL